MKVFLIRKAIHPTMPDLPASTAAQRDIVRSRGHGAIPPTSWALHVSPDQDAKIQATWVDAKGRKQYRYHSGHTDAAAAAKYDALKNFSRRLPSIRKKVDEDLKLPDSHPRRVHAAVVKLMDHTGMRVGSDRYARDNGSYGASSLRPEHVQVDGNKIALKFVGKRQKTHEKRITDKHLAAALSHFTTHGSDRLFNQRTKSGDLIPTTERHVAGYLKEHGVHPHQFRTYHATRLAASYLQQHPSDDPKEREKHVRAASKVAADFLGNTPEMALKSYINHDIVHHYREGHL